MFDKASRMKLRFDTSRGAVSVEDLWDLPLTTTGGKTPIPNLDDIARALHKQLKSGDDVSFVFTERKSDETIQLKFDIVKHIIDVRLAENQAAAQERTNKERKQQLLSIIADKQNQNMREMSLEDLRAEIAKL